jgi:hypothetical protein
MRRFRHPLKHVHVASPCAADWDQMLGSDQVRFCGQCSLNVYNLSGMRRADAEALIIRTEGRVCVRFYRRRDGSVITKDCPIGLAAVHRRLSRAAQAILAFLVAFMAALGLHEFISNRYLRSTGTMGVLALPGNLERSSEAATYEIIMGDLFRDPPPKRKLSKRR